MEARRPVPPASSADLVVFLVMTLPVFAVTAVITVMVVVLGAMA